MGNLACRTHEAIKALSTALSGSRELVIHASLLMLAITYLAMPASMESDMGAGERTGSNKNALTVCVTSSAKPKRPGRVQAQQAVISGQRPGNLETLNPQP